MSDVYIQKNIHTLISAFAIIRKNLPNLTLKIAGKAIDQNYLLEIRDAIVSAKLEDAVELLGEKSTTELIKLYQSCALFVFPSTVETFGNPLVEAMACGTPIVSSDSAAMPEILENAAKYFDPGNVTDMADTILSVLENQSEKQELITLAISRARSFSWHKTAAKTADVIKSVAPTRSSSVTKIEDCTPN